VRCSLVQKQEVGLFEYRPRNANTLFFAARQLNSLLANDRPPRDPRDRRGGGDRRPRKSNANTSNGNSSNNGKEGGNRNGGDKNKSRSSSGNPKGKQKDLAFSFKKKGNRSK
jgi:hypothetical protein